MVARQRTGGSVTKQLYGHQIDDLVRLADRADDWQSYAERHQDVPYTDEWAHAIVHEFITIMEAT